MILCRFEGFLKGLSQEIPRNFITVADLSQVNLEIYLNMFTTSAQYIWKYHCLDIYGGLALQTGIVFIDSSGKFDQSICISDFMSNR